MSIKHALIVAGMLAAAPVIGADEARPRVVAFNASVKVEVDATGRPVKVEAPAALPEAIRRSIEKRVATWQYQPAKQGGVAVPATTYVSVGACAIPTPAGNGFALGIDYKGNGPRLVSDADRMTPPPYPHDALIAGISGVYRVSYAIQPDGSTRIEDVVQLEGAGGRYLKSFRKTLSQWAQGMRYDPEVVNGTPVATTMSFPVVFRLQDDTGSRSEWRDRYQAELQARAISSKECMAASAVPDGLQPVARNSPVQVIPAPAG